MEINEAIFENGVQMLDMVDSTGTNKNKKR